MCYLLDSVRGVGLGMAADVLGVKLSGMKGGDPAVLEGEGQSGKTDGHVHIPVVNVGSRPSQTDGILNVQICLHRKKQLQTCDG